jgi:hypothetical protein
MGKAARVVAYVAGLAATVISMTLALVADGLPSPAKAVIMWTIATFAVVALGAAPYVAWRVGPLRRLHESGLRLRERALAVADPVRGMQGFGDELTAWKTAVVEALTSASWTPPEDRSAFLSAGANPPWTRFSGTSDKTRFVHDLEQHLTALQRVIERHR